MLSANVFGLCGSKRTQIDLKTLLSNPSLIFCEAYEFATCGKKLADFVLVVGGVLYHDGVAFIGLADDDRLVFGKFD